MYVCEQTYGDGAVLILQGVQEADAGLYRCIGRDPYGAMSYDDFNLGVVPGNFRHQKCRSFYKLSV